MVYFKPPGGRGTAPHQDNYYLRVHPGTCVAAWIALEDTDEENGCMIVVPGSQDFPIMCVVPADLEKFATSISVPLPDDIAPISVEMKAGDVLFFAGQLIHGSLPNISSDRFRPALACHYVVAEAEQVSQIDRPVLRFDGSEVELEASATGGECGVWVDEEDQRRIEITGEHARDLGMEEVLEQLNSNIWEEARAMKQAH
jgi:ectoine hydroxylase-related dioxygenase (phytanoyl-CoA dioxygenase family)